MRIGTAPQKPLSALRWLPLLWLCACTGPSGRESPSGSPSGMAGTSYARGFRVSDHGEFTILQVHDPWQHSSGVTFEYVLTEEPGALPDSLGDLQVFRTPVQRVVVMATSHAAMINRIGRGSSIVGMSGTRFVYDPVLRERIGRGKVAEVGYGEELDYERLVSLKPDVLFLYGVEGSVRARAEKLAELGIPVVFCAEYLESHPLGKAEWLLFVAAFYDKMKAAREFFNGVDSAYSELEERASGITPRPRILSGLPWKDTWFLPGGRSFAARLIRDAGGAYLWQEDRSTQAIPLDLESAFVTALDADIWINPGSAASLEQLYGFDERFAMLPVLQKGLVFNNNARITAAGGNDYWESGAIRPDLVLADMIRIFHPQLAPDHELIYYRKLK